MQSPRASNTSTSIHTRNLSGNGLSFPPEETQDAAPDADADDADFATPTSPISPQPLPADLPTSLNDRRNFDTYYPGETDFYDGWAADPTSSTFTVARPTSRALTFDLQLDSPALHDEDDLHRRLEAQDSEGRLMEMVAAQAQYRETGANTGEDVDAIATDETIAADEKKTQLQRALNMAASNGDTDRVKQIVNGRAKAFVDVNLPDDEGTVPLIYASCFGHEGVVVALLDAGAVVDTQDRNQWSALMWAITNRHKLIAKILLDHGASGDLRSASGGCAADFVMPGSELGIYLRDHGYDLAGNGAALGFEGEGDFYSAGGGFAPDDRFEAEYEESEVKRRMLMQESAANLEVDLSTLGFDEGPVTEDDEDEDEEFVWERCVGDQMFVFQTDKMGLILDTIVTHMTPQRSPSQKPVPANLIFLMARYAHYHMTGSLLEDLLTKAMDLINDVVERHQWDMTMLAFWISNCTLLLHYLKKDSGLLQSTTKYQVELAELINETFILIIRDAERRMNRVLDTAMLEHETIPGLSDVEFQGEWKMFKSKSKVEEEPPEKRFRPPSPKRRAQTSPRNITSLLSSTLFVLDLYDVHSVITSQILAQLLYWIGAELFNRVMTTRKYLSRTKAMQIRMNVSAIEDWARANNRQPEHYENGSTTTTGETTVDAARRHLAPIVQLLQWLQCFSSIGEDHDSLVGTLMQLQRLSPIQLISAVKSYRYEVGEKGLPKAHMKFLQSLQRGSAKLVSRPATPAPDSNTTDNKTATTPKDATDKRPSTPTSNPQPPTNGTPRSGPPPAPSIAVPVEPDTDPPTNPNKLTLDQSLMLPFSLPTSTDMLITYGAGIGGVNRERARKYIPSVPTEVLGKLNLDADGNEGRQRRASVGTVAGAWRSGNGAAL